MPAAAEQAAEGSAKNTLHVASQGGPPDRASDPAALEPAASEQPAEGVAKASGTFLGKLPKAAVAVEVGAVNW